MQKATVGFIGAGKMGGAIIRGILAQKLLAPEEIVVTARTEETLEKFRSLGVTVTNDAAELVQHCRFLFLAVKPQVLDAVLEPLLAHIPSDTVIVSIIAGCTEEYFRKKLGDQPVILAMPNTPLMLGYGATTVCCGAHTRREDFEMIKNLFAGIGGVEEIDPALSNEVIPVHGSSPAFIYLFAQEIVRSAEAMGLDPQQSNRLFAQTLIGAAHMMTDTGLSHQQLIDMVCSPGGTTLAAMNSFAQDHFGDVVEHAFRACVARARELAK